jgi:hypothetical protein
MSIRCAQAQDRREQGIGTGGRGTMGQARRIITWALVIFVFYTIITSPTRAADLVQIGFTGISNAAKAVGTFMTSLIK